MRLLNYLLVLALLGGSTLLVGCPPTDDDDSSADDDDATDDDDAAPEGFALVTTSDYVDTVIAKVDDAGAVNDDLLAIASGDILAAEADGDLLIIDRFTGAVQSFIDADLTGAPDAEFTVEDNPQRPLFCGGNLYFAQYDAGTVAVFDPDGGPMGSIDLTSYAEPSGDGSPEPAGGFVDGNTIVMALQRIDFVTTYAADPVGKIVEIDCTSNDVVGEHDVGANPVVFRHPLSEGSWLVKSGDFFAVDGAVKSYDPATGDWGAAAILDESVIGGDVTGFAPIGGMAVFGVWQFGTDTFDIGCVNLTSGDVTWGATGMAQNVWTVMQGPGEQAWAFMTPPYTDPAAVNGISIVNPEGCIVPGDPDWLTFGLPATGAAFFE